MPLTTRPRQLKINQTTQGCKFGFQIYNCRSERLGIELRKLPRKWSNLSRTEETNEIQIIKIR
jgi:hypothetical protein